MAWIALTPLLIGSERYGPGDRLPELEPARLAKLNDLGQVAKTTHPVLAAVHTIAQLDDEPVDNPVDDGEPEPMDDMPADDVYVCDECGKEYQSQGWLDRHIDGKH